MPRPPPPHVDRVVAALAYEGSGRALVLALKLRGLRCAAEPLGELLADRCLREGVLGNAVTWVPGRRRDIRRRGFDHAELIGEHVARRLGLQALPLLRRSGVSADQAGLDAGERWANLEDVFEATAPLGGSVIVVDDLVTTGATAAACAAALKAAGATTVELAAACSV